MADPKHLHQVRDSRVLSFIWYVWDVISTTTYRKILGRRTYDSGRPYTKYLYRSLRYEVCWAHVEPTKGESDFRK